MPLYLFYTMVQKSQKWPKIQIKGSLRLGHNTRKLNCAVVTGTPWQAVLYKQKGKDRILSDVGGQEDLRTMIMIDGVKSLCLSGIEPTSQNLAFNAFHWLLHHRTTHCVISIMAVLVIGDKPVGAETSDIHKDIIRLASKSENTKTCWQTHLLRKRFLEAQPTKCAKKSAWCRGENWYYSTKIFYPEESGTADNCHFCPNQ